MYIYVCLLIQNNALRRVASATCIQWHLIELLMLQILEAKRVDLRSLRHPSGHQKTRLLNGSFGVDIRCHCRDIVSDYQANHRTNERLELMSEAAMNR